MVDPVVLAEEAEDVLVELEEEPEEESPEELLEDESPEEESPEDEELDADPSEDEDDVWRLSLR